jgi:hypothetical protein
MSKEKEKRDDTQRRCIKDYCIRMRDLGRTMILRDVC